MKNEQHGHACLHPHSGNRRFAGLSMVAAVVPVFLCFALFGTAPAQEEDTGEGTAAVGEISELVEKIIDGMKKIDDNLLNADAAGTGDRMNENIRNIEELLKNTLDGSQQVVKDLDELIRRARYQNSGKG